MPWPPWQIVAFLALLCCISLWVWSPVRWHAAVRSSSIGRRALPLAFVIMIVLVYCSTMV